jgi:hypothetical protein
MLVIDVQVVAYALAVALLIAVFFVAYPLAADATAEPKHRIWRIALGVLILGLLIGDVVIVFFTPLVGNTVLWMPIAPDAHALELFSLVGLGVGVVGSLFGITSLLKDKNAARPPILAQLTIVLVLAVLIGAFEALFGWLDDAVRGCPEVYCAPVKISLAEHIGHLVFFALVGAFIGFLGGGMIVLIEAALVAFVGDAHAPSGKRGFPRSRIFWYITLAILFFIPNWASDLLGFGPPNAWSNPLWYTLFDVGVAMGFGVLLALASWLTRKINDADERRLGQIGVALILIAFLAQAVGPALVLLTP